MPDALTKWKGLWDYMTGDQPREFNLFDFIESWDMENRPWQGRSKYYDQKQQDIVSGNYDEIIKLFDTVKSSDNYMYNLWGMPTTGRDILMPQGDYSVNEFPEYQQNMPNAINRRKQSSNTDDMYYNPFREFFDAGSSELYRPESGDIHIRPNSVMEKLDLNRYDRNYVPLGLRKSDLWI